MKSKSGAVWTIGITGGVATGKTWVSKRFVEILNSRGVPAHRIGLDELQRALYAEDSERGQDAREAVAWIFGDDMLTPDRRTIKVNALKARYFSPATSMEERQDLRRIVQPHIEAMYEEATHGLSGIIVLEWAALIEDDMLDWVDHHVIIVDSPNRDAFIAERGIDWNMLRTLGQMQLSHAEKLARALQAIQGVGRGRMYEYVNTPGDDTPLYSLVDTVSQDWRLDTSPR